MTGPEKRYKGGYKTKVDRVKVFVFEKIQPLLSINLRKANDVDQEGVECLELQNNPPKTVFGTGTKTGTKTIFYIPFKYVFGTVFGTITIQINGTIKGLKREVFGTKTGIGIKRIIGGVFVV